MFIIPQDSNPTSPTSNDIPLFTFKSNASGHSDQKGGSHDKDQSSNPGAFTIKLNSVSSQTIKCPTLKKGILKHSSNEMLKCRPCDSTETSFCGGESAGSDAEDQTSSHSGELQSERSWY